MKSIAALIICLALIFVSTIQFSENAEPPDAADQIDLISIEQPYAGGYGGFLSTLYWVRSIFYYSGVIVEGDPPEPLVRFFRAAIASDTLWEHPALIASWALSQISRIPRADVVSFMSDGAERFPSQWKFRISWAVYVLEAKDLDSSIAIDSVAKILIPLSQSRDRIPAYARNLVYSLLHKSGKPEEAMDILLQTYAQVPDPLVRFQFQNKIADLLERNKVSLGASDSTAFFHAIGGMLDSKDPSQIGMAKRLLVRLVQPDHKASALAEAHQLAEQFKVYQKQAAAGR